MTIEQMKKRKQELGYSAEQLAELAGLPVSTVRKIFSGVTSSPRRETVVALERVLRKKQGEYRTEDFEQIPEGVYVEMLDGVLYGRESSEPLPQHIADALLGMRESPFDYGNLAIDKNTGAAYQATPQDPGERIDAKLYGLASPTIQHQNIVVEMIVQFRQYAQSKGHSCLVLPSIDVKFAESEKEYVEPDVVVVCDQSKVHKNFVFGAPDLIVEVLSSSTKDEDIGRKLEKYRHFGVREYLIVDGDTREVSHYFFEQSAFPDRHSFDEKIPVHISNGELELDLSML